MKTRFGLTALLAFALLLWLLRGVNLAQVWTHVQLADRWSMVGGLLFVALTYLTRAIRWQYLLAPIGNTRLRTTFRTTIIGFAALTLLPFRMGDLLRPYLLAKQERLSVPSTLATVAMERILDLMAVLVLLGVFLWAGSDATQLPPRAGAALHEVKFWGGIFAGISVAAVVVMWVLATHPKRAASLVMAVEHLASPRIAHKLADFVSYFSSGFGAMRSPVTLAWSVFWSFAIWLAIAAETWVVSRGFGIEMSFVGSFVMQPLLVLGVASGTPGGLGPYQWAYMLGVTTFFGATEESGVAASFVVWVISFVPVVLFGFIYMAQDGLSLGRLNQLASEARDTEPALVNEAPAARSYGGKGR
jgi:glycosyltransferase 2 family protein